MAQPSTRQELIDYCLRKLGAPVLEINVAEEQIEDLVDDAVQFFQERHFDGVSPTLLRYQITQKDIDRARGKEGVGITTVTGNKIYEYAETANYLQIPPYVIGVNKIFQFEGSNSISSGMFSIKYQLFLNDVYYWGSTELLTYSMVKTYLEDLDWLLTTQKQIRFNKREDRLYLDIDWSSITVGQTIIIDCYRALNPAESTKVWNDSFLKQYLTALIKRQWGQNLIKFRGVKLPGGIELDGRPIYDDAQRELDIIMERMSSTYELPPLDLIGYCLRKLGAPVLEINVAEEQIEDLVDDAVQFFQERHFDGVSPTLLRYQITQKDIDRARGKEGVGITTVTGNKIYEYAETANYLQIPPYVIGVNKIFQFEGSNSISSGMFSIKYQLFLNDVYYWGSTELLTYSMVKTYLEDLDWLLTTQKQIRFNKREDRLYLDIDWSSITVGQTIIIDCYRALNPAESTKVWNDSFLKQYLTALIKRQWGQNLIKFRGVKLPGGIELDGRPIYDDAQRELDIIMERMSSTYELPPLDLIG